MIARARLLVRLVGVGVRLRIHDLRFVVDVVQTWSDRIELERRRRDLEILQTVTRPDPAASAADTERAENG
ncbi:MAG: hypothetical protein AB7Q17_15760 [Phycisphaerae bacterium]